MQVVCIDSKGHRICELEYSLSPNSLESKNWVQITSLQDIRPAQDADFTKLPILHHGFLDSHMHPSWMAKLLSQIDLTQKPILQIKDEILSSTKETIYGFGWNEVFHNIPLEEASKFFDSNLPQNKELYLFRKCGHSAYLSHTAKKMLNIAHSELIKDDELHKIPSQKITSLEFTENFQKVLLKLKQEGIFACCDLLLSGEDLQRLSNFEDTDFDLQYFGDIHDLERFQGLSRKRTPYVKFFLDGSLGSKSAWLSTSYKDDPRNKGIQIWSDEDLFKKTKEALDQNFLVAFHAIGDAALDQALRLGEALAPQLEKVLKDSSQKLFHRLEHLQVCRDDQIEKIKKQNLWSLGLQPSHRVADSTFVLNRLGEERCLKNSYRLKSFLDAGLKVSLGSDAPIVSSNPLECLKASTQDPRASEKISLSQSFELMIRSGRQNTGFEVKNLRPQSRAWLSNYG